MAKKHIVRDFFIAVALGVVALFLIGYVRVGRDREIVPSDYGTSDTFEEMTDSTDSAAISTGVAGTAVVGPQCPTIRESEECPDEPFVGVVDLLVNDPERELIARVPTNANGSFGATLLPGEYIVVVQHTGTFPICPEEVVVVEEGTVTDVLVSCDSGIR